MEEEGLGYDEQNILSILKRFEDMRRKRKILFFDVAEFESIIDYYLETNSVASAYEAVKAALKQHPMSVSIQLKKARVLIDKGRAGEALSIVRRLESLEPANFEIFLIKGAALGMMGDIQGTRKNFDYALSLDPSDEPNILASIVSILQNLNHYELIIPYLERLAQLEPDFHSHMYDLAFSLEKSGREKESISCYERYLDNEPFSDSAWYNLGILYGKEGWTDKALESYDYCLAINPENFFAIFNKGNLLSNLGRFKEALEIYLQYLEHEFESSEAMTYAAECYDNLGEPDKAKALYNDAIEIDPEFPEPWFGLGVISFKEKKLTDSIYHFRKAVELDRENPEYWFYLGKSYYLNGDTKPAVRSFIEALKLDQEYDMVWLYIGHIIISRKLYKRINVLLERSLRISGDLYGLSYILASSYLYSGNPEKCNEHLLNAIRSGGESFTDYKELFPSSRLDASQIEIIKKFNR